MNLFFFQIIFLIKFKFLRDSLSNNLLLILEILYKNKYINLFKDFF